MTGSRRLASLCRSWTALIVALALAAATPAPALAAGSSTSQLTPTAPSRLTQTTSGTTSTASSGSLPYTGTDLLPEAVIGLALVGAGIALHLRRSRA